MARTKAPPTRIQKSGNGHRYFLDGEPCVGVTGVLGDGIPKPGLIGWAAGTVADFVVNRLTISRNGDGVERIDATDMVEEALRWNQTRTRPTPVSPGERLPRTALVDIFKNLRYKDLDEASNRGTEVHRLAVELAHGNAVEVPPELAGHVRSYVAFLDEWAPYNAVVERVIINRKWRYMGRFDLLADFDDLPPWIAERIGSTSGRGLLDVKTSRSGIYAETALQLEAYRRGETMLDDAGEVAMPVVDFVAAIHVRADGYDVHAFDIVTDSRPTTFDIFLYAMQVGRWLDWKEGPAATIKSPALRKARR